MYISDWKQSALRFLTRPRLGQGAMGLSKDSFAMKKHTITCISTTHRLHDVERWARGGFFLSLSMR